MLAYSLPNLSQILFSPLVEMLGDTFVMPVKVSQAVLFIGCGLMFAISFRSPRSRGCELKLTVVRPDLISNLSAPNGCHVPFPFGAWKNVFSM